MVERASGWKITFVTINMEWVFTVYLAHCPCFHELSLLPLTAQQCCCYCNRCQTETHEANCFVHGHINRSYWVWVWNKLCLFSGLIFLTTMLYCWDSSLTFILNDHKLIIEPLRDLTASLCIRRLTLLNKAALKVTHKNLKNSVYFVTEMGWFSAGDSCLYFLLFVDKWCVWIWVNSYLIPNISAKMSPFQETISDGPLE